MSVKFTSHADEVLAALHEAITSGMDMIGGVAEQHAKSATPVKTGKLRDSIKHEASGAQEQTIGTEVEYAPFVELGTSRMRAQPYLRPAAENYKSEYEQIMRSALGL